MNDPIDPIDLDGWDDPDPDRARPRDLRIAADAAAELGIPVGTIHSWRSRGRLRPAGIDDRGRPMYDLTDLAQLADPGP